MSGFHLRIQAHEQTDLYHSFLLTYKSTRNFKQQSLTIDTAEGTYLAA